MHKNNMRNLAILAVAGMIGWFIAGCASGGAGGASTQPSESASARKGGAELWAETCGRCHNVRSPSEYNAQEWGIIVEQMRLRAGLTGDEQREITKFLKSASGQ